MGKRKDGKIVILGRMILNAREAKWLKHLFCNQKIVGSIPSAGIFLILRRRRRSILKGHSLNFAIFDNWHFWKWRNENNTLEIFQI